jgi:hypothetical protein
VSSDRLTHVAASSLLAETPAAVFAFLADPQNHLLLAGPKVQLVQLVDLPGQPMHAVMVIRGPAGLRRRADTEIVTSHDPVLLSGVAELGDATTAWVSWNLHPVAGGGTRVILSASVQSASVLDRILLLVGGKRWIRRLFAETLERLGSVVGAAGAAGAAAAEQAVRPAA